MRIGYLVPEFPAQTHAFFWREVAGLRELGHDVCLFSTTRPTAEASPHAFTAVARDQTVYVAPPSVAGIVASLRPGVIRRIPAVLRYIRDCRIDSMKGLVRLLAIALCASKLRYEACRRDLDHLHIHSCADAAHLGAMANLLGGPSYSLTLHGDLPVYGRDHSQKMRGASFVSAVTKPLQAQICDVVGLEPDRVPVIWMGVDTETFSPAARIPGSSTRPLTLVTVARLNRTKGHRYALDAIQQARSSGVDLRYVVAGSGPEEQAIRQQVADLGLEDVVEMRGPVSESTVLDLLRDSDVFILPSFGLGEAAPVSVMEAMSCALPVVASRIGGTGDMITNDHDGLLVAQEDSAALAEAIVGLSRDPDRRRTMGLVARERAISEFDFRLNAEKLAAAIRRGRG